MRSIIILFACAGACWSWASLGAPQVFPISTNGPQFHLKLELTPAQKERLEKALQGMHARYDPGERMLSSPFSSPGYHTTLKGGTVHSTRAALDYAVALLDTGEEQWRLRAVEILRRLIDLQDQDPASRTYGIWSWFLEEPLAKMSPPDWNWADFCGTDLLQAALYHRDRLPADLQVKLDAAIQHAARSIQRRNVGPDYTNIAIMGSYVTLMAAELYGLEDLREYALARWRRFYEHTMRNRAFTEYNSPTYTIVALKELGRMRQQVRDPEARKLTEEIYRLAWEEIAQHWHAPTRQWAGPHSRSYRTLLGSEALGIIQRGTEGRVSFGTTQSSIDEHRIPLPCPRDLEPLFTTLDTPRTLVKTFKDGTPPIIGTTYLHPKFTLGSINRGDLWNQRRSLVAYWGTANEPSYLHLRFLHDNYDFSAAQFFSAQKEGQVLAGINFAVDGGDTHVSLDRIKNATFKAKDLRLRFEFGGSAGTRSFKPPNVINKCVLDFGDVHIALRVLMPKFAGLSGTWETGLEQGKAWLDLVLYSGPERTFNLSEIEQAVMGLYVNFYVGEPPAITTESHMDGQRLSMQSGSLRLSIPVKPAKVSELQKAFESK